MSDVTDYLDQVQARADAATEGPWAHYGGGGFEVYSAVEYSNGMPGPYVARWCRDADDADFIAAARADVPRLVAALRAVLELHESFEFDGARRCRECADHDDRDYSAPWPCPTVQVVTEALEVG